MHGNLRDLVAGRANLTHRVGYEPSLVWHIVLYILEGIIPLLFANLSRHGILHTNIHSQIE